MCTLRAWWENSVSATRFTACAVKIWARACNPALGLWVRHRGQESSGIVSLHEKQHIVHRGDGLVGDLFKESDLIRLQGNAAIGHNRYSTTGANLVFNIQPLSADLLNGPVALAHNGNFVN